MDVIWLKVIAFFSFIIVGGGFALLPWGFQRVESKSRQVIITLADCFAGGVFLGTGWVHLLPESAEALANINSGVPLANMLSVCGFLVVFLLEKVFFLSEEEQQHLAQELAADQQRANPHPHGHGHTHSHSSTSGPAIIPVSNSSSDVEIEILPTLPHPESPSSETSVTDSIQDNSATPQLRTRKEKAERELSHEHGTSRLISSPSGGSAAQQLLPYVLMIVLSVHSIIAGLTLGVQTDISGLATLFIAIISHKWTESFALGVSLLKLGNFRKFLKAVAFYTMMVPSGLILGSILSVALSGETAVLTTAILNGIASGTFIYIALVDILLEQFNDASLKFFKYIFLAIGFILITGMFLMFDEE